MGGLGLLALAAPTGGPPTGAAKPKPRVPAHAVTPSARLRPAAWTALLPADASDRDVMVAEACKRGLGGTQGSVIAMDPRTGRVHALLNPVHGLANAYQPCSVFKIVTAIAGLSEGVITPETTFQCSKGCWNWAGHGAIQLRRALAVSCNPFF